MFRKKRYTNELHNELLLQLNGLLEIEIGNYIYENGEHLNLRPHIEINGGIDVYIFDGYFAKLTKNNKIDFYSYFQIDDISDISDISLIGHYHYDDLLYLIINFKEEKKEMIKKIDRYIEWKENYLAND